MKQGARVSEMRLSIRSSHLGGLVTILGPESTSLTMRTERGDVPAYLPSQRLSTSAIRTCLCSIAKSRGELPSCLVIHRTHTHTWSGGLSNKPTRGEQT